MTLNFLIPICNLLPGPDTPLYWQMRVSYNEAVAPGTARNKRVQAYTYIKFMLIYNFNYLAPTVANAAMYAQFLANSYSSPATVKNYLSGAKTWTQHHLGDISSFESPELSKLVKSFVSTSTHIPTQAAPLSPEDVKNICIYLDATPSIPRVIKAAILIAYSAFLRVSNVLSPSLCSWGGPHTLRMSDITVNHTGIWLLIRSTKTLKGPRPAYIQILPTNNPTSCPVLAWMDYVQQSRPCPLGPAFVLPSGLSLTPSPLVATMRLALQAIGHPDPQSVSFHSLRRGGARAAANSGVDHNQIMDHGLWASKSGLAAYLPKSPRLVPSIIARSLAK